MSSRCFFWFQCLKSTAKDSSCKRKKKRLGSYVLCKPSTGIAFPAGSKRVITSGRVANKNSGFNSSLSHGVRDIQFLFLTIYTLKSGCIFSILFSIHFLKCWREEFVWQSRTSLVGDHFLYSRDPHGWFRGDIVRRNYMLVTLRGQIVQRGHCRVTKKKTVHTLILAVWGTSILTVWSLNNWGGMAGMLHGGGAGPFTGLSIGWPDNTKILTNYSFICLRYPDRPTHFSVRAGLNWLPV